ncbi:MAG: DUF5666 domain-containing protein [Candidatus Binatia bacterium]
MFIRSVVFSLIGTLVLGATAFAHGNETHVMGTITALDTSQMTVKTRDNTSLTIRLSRHTIYRDASGKRTDARPTAGSRVVVDVTGRPGEFEATEIRFSVKPGKSHADQRLESHEH